VNIKRIKANETKTTTKPIIASVILPLALSAFFLSPSEVTQSTPPQMANRMAKTTAAMRSKLIPILIMLFSIHSPPVGTFPPGETAEKMEVSGQLRITGAGGGQD